MKITHIMRGTEFLPSVPKHKLLYEAFGWEPPVYVHLPLILGADGGKLSKRKGDAFFEDFMEKGFLVPALVNFIALLGFSPGGGKEIFTTDELVEVFDVKGLNRAPAVLDMQKLKWMNGEYIKALPFDEFYDLAAPYLDKAVKCLDADKKLLARVIQSRISTLGEIAEILDFIDNLPDYNIDIFINKKNKVDASVSRDVLLKLLPELEGLDESLWSCAEKISEFLKGFVEAEGVKAALVFWPLRCALSGKEASPGGASELLAAFGKNESISRIKTALGKLSA
jgi:glutamyl-tRNA synthetase